MVDIVMVKSLYDNEWEYVTHYYTEAEVTDDMPYMRHNGLREDPLKDNLNSHGNYGWELVSIVRLENKIGKPEDYNTLAVFKRPRLKIP